MSYKSVLAHACIGRDNSSIFAVSAQLAGMFDARVIGIAGARVNPPFTEVPVGEMMEYERQAAETALKTAESDFQDAMRGHNIELSWRSNCDFQPVSDFVAREARAADLVVTAPEPKGFLDQLEEPRLGPLVLQAGRPVLVVPKDQSALSLRRVAVAWKETPEARRAVADALPLLKKADDVLVLEACPAEELEQAARRTGDVADWLKKHGVPARAQAEVQKESDLGALYAVLRREKPDLVVAGAYGHTRLREWVFGGVTMDLLLPGNHCVLLSH